jgi:ACT domain-containing protein
MPTEKLMVNIYLSSDEKKKAEQAAKAIGISLSSYIKVKLFREREL